MGTGTHGRRDGPRSRRCRAALGGVVVATVVMLATVGAFALPATAATPTPPSATLHEGATDGGQVLAVTTNGSPAHRRIEARGRDRAVVIQGCRLLLGTHAKGLTKTVARTDESGVAILHITLTSGGPPGVHSVRDCGFVDADLNGKPGRGETMISYLNNAAVFAPAGGGSVFTFTMAVDAQPTDRICDRARRSGAGGLERTAVVCVGGPDPVLAESHTPAVLVVGGTGMAAAALFVTSRARRRSDAPAAA